VPLDLPRLRADRMAVFQGLDNVVDNAIKYSTGTARALTVRARAEGAFVRLDVVDRGRGIPEVELPHVFDRFYRGRGAAPGGSGLGLAIVRRVVADHRGRIDITSRVDEGTTVVLMLPTEKTA
jgi:signal transduction histidine kinase